MCRFKTKEAKESLRIISLLLTLQLWVKSTNKMLQIRCHSPTSWQVRWIGIATSIRKRQAFPKLWALRTPATRAPAALRSQQQKKSTCHSAKRTTQKAASVKNRTPQRVRTWFPDLKAIQLTFTQTCIQEKTSILRLNSINKLTRLSSLSKLLWSRDLAKTQMRRSILLTTQNQVRFPKNRFETHLACLQTLEASLLQKWVSQLACLTTPCSIKECKSAQLVRRFWTPEHK